MFKQDFYCPFAEVPDAYFRQRVFVFELALKTKHFCLTADDKDICGSLRASFISATVCVCVRTKKCILLFCFVANAIWFACYKIHFVSPKEILWVNPEPGVTYLTFLYLLLGVENVKRARCGEGGQVLGGCSNPDIVCAVLHGAALYLKDCIFDSL